MPLRTLEMLVALSVTAVASIASAALSRGLVGWRRIVLFYALGLVSATTWAWMVRRTPWGLLATSALWDAFYNAAFAVTLIVITGTTNPYQIAGMVLLVVSLVLLGF